MQVFITDNDNKVHTINNVTSFNHVAEGLRIRVPIDEDVDFPYKVKDSLSLSKVIELNGISIKSFDIKQ
jgi:hypothetical protein